MADDSGDLFLMAGGHILIINVFSIEKLTHRCIIESEIESIV